MTAEELSEAAALYRDFGSTILGIISDQPRKADVGNSEEELMGLLIALRKEARASKNFPLSDRIRDGLKDLGIVLEDRKDGTGWKRA